LEDSVDHPGAVAKAQTEQRNGDLGFVYRHAIKGYSAELSKGAVETLRNDPRVKHVTPDGKVKLASQTLPTGVSRIFAPTLPALDIDETDDVRVNVDVAVIDSGIDHTHPDLNVVSRTDCTAEVLCADGSGIDGYGHGTHVAGTVGAIDNGFGVVGVAPGARLWGVKVCENFGSCFWSWVIAGVDWVTAHSSSIEVVNMSLAGEGPIPAVTEAIEASIEAGVVYVAAAGNEDRDTAEITPANIPDVIAVSALSDYNGAPGGLAKETSCSSAILGKDDVLASYSNWGSVIDIAAPGSCIDSTMPGQEYRSIPGTSMASPHVAGAAAILASESNPSSKADVEAITAELLQEGSLNWTDDSSDGVREPLLDLRAPGREAITFPASGLQTHSAQLNGVASAGGLTSTYRFEYGTSTEYGSSAPASPQSIGSGTGDLEVAQQIPVEPETVYHYRLAVTNSAGTSYGEDREFVTSKWSIQPTPLPSGAEGVAQFNDVSCASSVECVGIGLAGTSPFAERWNGSEWSSMSVPTPTGTNVKFEGISCISPSSCRAVGVSNVKSVRTPFVEVWDGSSWTLSTMPVPGGLAPKGPLRLTDVSCVTSTFCLAVGSYATAVTGSGVVTEEKTLVESWNGVEWAIASSPNPAGQAISQLTAVSCASSSACMAVGNSSTSSTSGDNITLAAHWNGSEWSLQSPPNPSGAKETVFADVSCSSATTCVAVGNSNKEKSNLTNDPLGLTESWDGSSWTLQASNLSKPLYGLSCSSSNSCVAVGADSGQRWNGSEWLTQAAALPEGTQANLVAVSCRSATVCTAVGSYYAPRSSASHGYVPLAERLTPSWSTQTTPNPTPKTENSLADVACPSSTKCLAAGNDEYRAKEMLQAWNGSEWKIVNNAFDGHASALACGSATSCMMVGYSGSEPRSWKVTEQNPSSWSASQKSIVIPEGGSLLTLRDVSCASTTSCIAVGSYYNGSEWKSLAESWNGTAWSLQSVPNPPEGNAASAMISVHCSSSTSCVAIGEAASKPLATTWNGTSWSAAMLPRPAGATSAGLEGIHCLSASSCRAVGYSKETGKMKRALAESWNGSSWSIQATPNPGEGEVNLRSLSCTSASSCTAVGSYVSKWNAGSGVEEERKTLVEYWNGSEWAIQPSTNPKPFSLLSNVSCSASTACTAVGDTRPESGSEGRVTLAERYE
ncbi:MAG TPA: S8 family serine peptidase, partial [Gemmatimonadales bacterium]|nr:S8 family serine peptidase [Gemmatimonadales bacterium]